jgi:catechol 2,3-dioxygenase-like lactoylglutathione lyase family enzyme
MLAPCKLVAFLAATDAPRAKTFYRDILGLKLLAEDGFALVFEACGAPLRIALVERVVNAPYTVIGWEVPDIATTARGLSAAGVSLERFPGMQQDAFGVWSSPGGAQVAWFKDPDGNLLSLTQAC